MSDGSSNPDRYLVGALVQACGVMAAFQKPGELLRLRDVVSRTGLSKGTVFRLLYTLRNTGFVEKTGDIHYRLRVALPSSATCRLAYAMNSKDEFTREVTSSLAQAAADADIELIIFDNKDNPATTLHNADLLIREHPHLAIEFQGDQSIADELATKFAHAKVPLLALDVPHPGAFYFGANNYQAGLIGGRHMGRWANSHWSQDVPDIVLIGYTRAGSLPQSRVKGILAGFHEVWKHAACRVVQLDSIGDFDSALQAVRAHMRRTPARKTLVGAVNDPAALAALQAFEEAGMSGWCAVMGQNAELDARTEMRRNGSRLIGSVAYFPERYGPMIIGLARKITGGLQPPPAVFTKHLLVTPENVDVFYPNDSLTRLPAAQRIATG